MRPRYSNEGGSFLIIRDEHLLITGGNVVAAALIHIFEHWYYHKRSAANQNKQANDVAERHGDERTIPENLYQWHTTESLELQLKGLGSKRTIQEARQLLCDLGVITEHRNPNPRYTFDRTVHFMFYPDVVAEIIARKDHTVSPSEQMSQRTDQKGQYPYISSIDNDINDFKDTAAAGASVGKPPPTKDPPKAKKKRAPGAEPDREWQRWVDAWFDFFKARHDGISPMFNGAQSAALKGLRQYLCKVATPIEGKTVDDCGYIAWKFILDNWDRLREWLQEQFDLTVVLKKINDILNSLRNGTKTNRGNNTNGTGTSQQRVEAIKNY